MVLILDIDLKPQYEWLPFIVLWVYSCGTLLLAFNVAFNILEQNFLKNGGVVRSCVQIACFLHQNDCCVNQFYVGRITAGSCFG